MGRFGWLVALPLLGLPGMVGGETFVWIDEAGTTHLTSDPERVPAGRRDRVVGEGAPLAGLWGGEVRGPEPAPARRDSRQARILRAAVDDLRRGESARARALLVGVVREDRANAPAHWYLALLERQRGRFETAADHLREFLTHAGPEHEAWRASARRHLAALEDERRLAEGTAAAQGFGTARSAHFRIRYDGALAEASPGYADTVLRYLEEAHALLAAQWGAAPAEPTRVVLYGKAAYVVAHAHRFSFETVGFFDGRIHVVSAAHPAGELRSLLFHEYTHALFREQTGGDRPYWLNEGLAEIAERASRQETVLSRGERVRLRDRILAGDWIPLARLAPSFAGLEGRDARDAYTESTAAVRWILARTGRFERARLLAALARGEGADAALRDALGTDQPGLEAALQEEILSGFPAPPPGARQG